MKKILLTLLAICSITSSYAIVATKQVADCVEIVLKNGEKFPATITQNAATVLKYRRCDYIDGSEVRIAKNKIASIKTASGEVIFQNDPNNILIENKAELFDQSELNLSRYSLTSLLSFFIGTIVLLTTGNRYSLLLYLLGIMLGVAGIIQVKSKPTQYKGSELGIVSTVLNASFLIMALFIAALIGNWIF